MLMLLLWLYMYMIVDNIAAVFLEHAVFDPANMPEVRLCSSPVPVDFCNQLGLEDKHKAKGTRESARHELYLTNQIDLLPGKI